MSTLPGLQRLTAGAAAVTVVAGIALIAPVTPARAAGSSLVVWADQIRADVLKQEFPKGFRGTKLKIVVKESLASIKDDLKTVKAADAPDVIAAEHDSTGELVNAKLVRRISMTKPLASLFPSNVLAGF
ncbi:MAG: hypothetical protein WC005_06860, partial [Candidatus Nanopelagicales bacterium]